MKEIIQKYILNMIADKLNIIKDQVDISEVKTKNPNIRSFKIKPIVQENEPEIFCLMSPQNMKVIDIQSIISKTNHAPIPSPLINILKKQNIQIMLTDNFKRHGIKVDFIRNGFNVERNIKPMIKY